MISVRIDASRAPASRRATPHRARAVRIALVLTCALALSAPGADAAKDEKVPAAAAPRLDAEGIYAMTMTKGGTGIHVVEYWSKGATLRAHTTISGHPFVTIVSKDMYYTLDPIFKRGVAIARGPRSMAADKGRRRLFGNEFEDMVAAGAEKIRSEKSPAGLLDVYRLTNEEGKRTVWVTADEYRLPLKFETFDRRTGVDSSLDYLSWSPLRLRDDFFDPPTVDWEIERVETYEEWLRAPANASFKQAPVIFPLLLHGRP